MGSANVGFVGALEPPFACQEARKSMENLNQECKNNSLLSGHRSPKCRFWGYPPPHWVVSLAIWKMPQIRSLPENLTRLQLLIVFFGNPEVNFWTPCFCFPFPNFSFFNTKSCTPSLYFSVPLYLKLTHLTHGHFFPLPCSFCRSIPPVVHTWSLFMWSNNWKRFTVMYSR